MSIDDKVPPRGEPVGVELFVSVGLAQFISDIEMSTHHNFDGENEDHLDLMREFVELKRSIREDIEPLLELKEMLEMVEGLMGEEDKRSVIGVMLDEIAKEEKDEERVRS